MNTQELINKNNKDSIASAMNQLYNDEQKLQNNNIRVPLSLKTSSFEDAPDDIQEQFSRRESVYENTPEKNSLDTNVKELKQFNMQMQLLDQVTPGLSTVYKKALYQDYLKEANDPLSVAEMGIGHSKYDKNLFSGLRAAPVTVEEIYENRANSQSGWEKIRNGAYVGLKSVRPTLTSIVSGTVNLFLDVTNIESEFGNFMDNLSTSEALRLQEARNKAPIYTSEEHYDKNLLQQVGTSDFWANLLASAGFQATTGAVTGGTTTVGGMIGGIPGTIIGLLLGGFLAAVGESEVEASSHKIESIQSNTANLENAYWKEWNAIMSRYKSNSESPYLQADLNELNSKYEKTLQVIKEDADDQSNFVFNTNFALLYATNLLQTATGIFGGGFKAGRLALKTGKLDKAANVVVQTSKPLYATKEIGKHLLGATFEGVQEVGQSAIRSASSLIDDYNVYNTMDLNMDKRNLATSKLQALGEGISEVIGDKHTKAEFLSGFVTGLIGMPRLKNNAREALKNKKNPISWGGSIINAAIDMQQEYKKETKIIDNINKYLSENKNTGKIYDELVKMLTTDEILNQALLEGDKFAFKNAEHLNNFSYLSILAKLGQLNSFKKSLRNSLQNIKNMPEEEFEEFISQTIDAETKSGPFTVEGTTNYEEARKSIVKRLNRQINNLDKYLLNRENIIANYSNANEESQEALLFYSMSKDNINERLKELSSKLKDNNVNISLDSKGNLTFEHAKDIDVFIKKDINDYKKLLEAKANIIKNEESIFKDPTLVKQKRAKAEKAAEKQQKDTERDNVIDNILKERYSSTSIPNNYQSLISEIKRKNEKDRTDKEKDLLDWDSKHNKILGIYKIIKNITKGDNNNRSSYIDKTFKSIFKDLNIRDIKNNDTKDDYTKLINTFETLALSLSEGYENSPEELFNNFESNNVGKVFKKYYNEVGDFHNLVDEALSPLIKYCNTKTNKQHTNEEFFNSFCDLLEEAYNNINIKVPNSNTTGEESGETKETKSTESVITASDNIVDIKNKEELKEFIEKHNVDNSNILDDESLDNIFDSVKNNKINKAEDIINLIKKEINKYSELNSILSESAYGLSFDDDEDGDANEAAASLNIESKMLSSEKQTEVSKKTAMNKNDDGKYTGWQTTTTETVVGSYTDIPYVKSIWTTLLQSTNKDTYINILNEALKSYILYKFLDDKGVFNRVNRLTEFPSLYVAYLPEFLDTYKETSIKDLIIAACRYSKISTDNSDNNSTTIISRLNSLFGEENTEKFLNSNFDFGYPPLFFVDKKGKIYGDILGKTDSTADDHEGLLSFYESIESKIRDYNNKEMLLLSDPLEIESYNVGMPIFTNKLRGFNPFVGESKNVILGVSENAAQSETLIVNIGNDKTAAALCSNYVKDGNKNGKPYLLLTKTNPMTGEPIYYAVEFVSMSPKQFYENSIKARRIDSLEDRKANIYDIFNALIDSYIRVYRAWDTNTKVAEHRKKDLTTAANELLRFIYTFFNLPKDITDNHILHIKKESFTNEEGKPSSTYTVGFVEKKNPDGKFISLQKLFEEEDVQFSVRKSVINSEIPFSFKLPKSNKFRTEKYSYNSIIGDVIKVNLQSRELKNNWFVVKSPIKEERSAPSAQTTKKTNISNTKVTLSQDEFDTITLLVQYNDTKEALEDKLTDLGVDKDSLEKIFSDDSLEEYESIEKLLDVYEIAYKSEKDDATQNEDEYEEYEGYEASDNNYVPTENPEENVEDIEEQLRSSLEWLKEISEELFAAVTTALTNGTSLGINNIISVLSDKGTTASIVYKEAFINFVEKYFDKEEFNNILSTFAKSSDNTDSSIDTEVLKDRLAESFAEYMITGKGNSGIFNTIKNRLNLFSNHRDIINSIFLDVSSGYANISVLSNKLIGTSKNRDIENALSLFEDNETQKEFFKTIKDKKTIGVYTTAYNDLRNFYNKYLEESKKSRNSKETLKAGLNVIQKYKEIQTLHKKTAATKAVKKLAKNNAAVKILTRDLGDLKTYRKCSIKLLEQIEKCN